MQSESNAIVQVLFYGQRLRYFYAKKTRYTHKTNTKKEVPENLFSKRRCHTFPGSFPPSIICVTELNYCVRDGNRCDLRDIITGFSIMKVVPSKPNNAAFKNHWSSVRPISIGQLNTLPYLHLRPINVVVSHGS